MKIEFTFEGDNEEFDGLLESVFQSKEGTADGFPELIYLGQENDDDVTVSGDVSTAGREQIGSVQKLILLTKWVRSGKTLREFRRLTDSQFLHAIKSVAAANGVTISAIGDGKLLEQFLAFINEHWDEILALLLKLIGL